MCKNFVFPALFVLAGALPGFAQTSSLLQSGPMLGYADMKEVLLWAQTTRAATVDFVYWDVEAPDNKYVTDAVRTEKNTAFTAKCIADQVEPGRQYAYDLRIDGQPVPLPYPTLFKTQPLWRWRTDPPAFSLATGSCAYVNEPAYDRPGTPYGSEYQIFGQIAAQKPDLMVWLGDNTYLREPDWSTRTGTLHRYTHDRSLPELQALLAATHHYAIWDDHDFGPNDSDGTWVHKETAWEVFRAFWGNPTFGLNDQKGCTTWFQYVDIDFFLLDDRYFRTPNDCASCEERTMLGKEQLRWFLSALAGSRAPFKIVAVGNQVLSSNTNNETFTRLYPAEHDSILAHIERENIRGVVFLTGDRHFTELSALKNARGNWVYDLTTSSLTAGVNTNARKEANNFQVAGTVVDQHNFSVLRFSGPRTQRQLGITVYNADGKELWTKTILPNGEIGQ
ncbi:MAG: alkaline phosphatase family protein [Saprospirales bacterium]|nr:alkaline phosphatase family protein [Saprospirales bacterium]